MYKSLDVLKSGGGDVPNSVVYKYSDPSCLLSRLVVLSVESVALSLAAEIPDVLLRRVGGK